MPYNRLVIRQTERFIRLLSLTFDLTRAAVVKYSIVDEDLDIGVRQTQHRLQLLDSFTDVESGVHPASPSLHPVAFKRSSQDLHQSFQGIDVN